MSSPDLSPSDLSYLSDCRLIAAENYVFYERVYFEDNSEFDAEIIGRVMAQKKDFIDAINLLLENCEAEESYSSLPKTQKLVLTLPSNDQFFDDGNALFDFVKHHEAKFDEALTLTLENIKGVSIKELIGHHLEASRLAVDAIFGD